MHARVVVTDHAFASTHHERRVAESHHAEFAEHACTTEVQTLEVMTEADVAFVNFAPVSRRVLGAMKPNSTVIRYGVGVDNVDLNAAREFGIKVANVPDYGVETVADHAAAGLLTLSRRIPFYDRGIKEEGWVSPTSLGPVRSWRRHTVGFLGFGRIAQALHRRLAPFGATFVVYDPFCADEVLASHRVERMSLEELAARSTALSVHVPLTPETRDLVDSDFLAAMPSGAILVNTARGGIVDEAALLHALDTGHMAGAMLDVTTVEPLPADSPLRGHDRVLLTPHAAFYDEESLDDLQRLASEEADRALLGKTLRCQVT